MSKLAKALTAAAGNAGGDNLYVEDVFSTYLYEGDGQSNRDIVNGIDLSNNGGLVWLKTRSTSYNHFLNSPSDITGYAQLPLTAAWTTSSNLVTFNDDGFRIPIAYSGANASNSTSSMASWTFRKAEKFFDVVTWTGDGNAATQISHSLNSTPGAIIVKKTSATGNWSVYHSYLGTGNYLRLEQYFGDTTDADYFPEVTDSYFRPGSDNHVNESGQSFVAYLFASDAGGFGDDGDENIIKCGSYTGTGSLVDVNVGFEPQFVIVKSADFGNSDTDWFIIDTMRGFTFEPNTNYEFKALRANESSAEAAQGRCGLTSTGFVAGPIDATGASGRNYVYIAIRRPMKTPESGTEVFAVGTNQEVPSATSGFYSGFPVDMAIKRIITASQSNRVFDRLRGAKALVTSTTAAETGFGAAEFDHQNGWYYDDDSANTNDYSWMFKRATGFFDVVAYTGDGTASRQITHNLGAAPELLIVKGRSTTNNGWQTWHKALPDDGAWASNVFLNSTDSYGGFQRFDGAATQTAAYFTTGNNGEPNTSSQTYIAYLFATLDGVSKVGSYTGTGSNVDVDCGFSAGARFILIKRTDSASQWYLWDSKRGIVAGNDPWIELNNTNAQNSGQDAIDPLASGFTVTAAADVNQPSGTYIFLAIA